MAYDLLIRGGTLVDPAQGIHARRDVAFAGGKVAAVGADLSTAEAAETIDATGKIVTPGLIDLHAHVFHDISHFGIEPDRTCLATGATTVLDAGSAGADTMGGFRRFVIAHSATRVLVLLNISSQGLLTAWIGENNLPEYADVARAVASAQQHPGVVVGIKVRLTRNTIVSERVGMLPLYRAREAADALGLPLMVHPQDAWCDSLDDVLAYMRPGDLLTHCFHGHRGGVLDEQGRVRPAVREAQARGVLFDVGHGGGSFKWETVERALAQGLVPDTISTDLHTYSLLGPVYSMPTTVSKFMHLGLSLDEAIARATIAPARAFPALDGLGTLTLGAPGDAVVFDLQEGVFPLFDAHEGVRTGRQMLVPVAVVKDGRRVRTGFGQD